MPGWPHLDYQKLRWIAVLALLWGGRMEALAQESHPSASACVIDRLKLIPKYGDSALLKFSEIRKKSEGALARTEPTVKMVSQLEGVHGGELYVIKKTGTHWFSAYEAERYAPQGDPTWFPLMSGPKTAYFFGFRRISSEEMTIPNVNEVTGAIEKLNRSLSHDKQEAIGIRFYPATDDAIASDEEFLRKFADQKALPMAVNGPVAIHDVSYHLSAVFLPNQVIDHGAQITKRLLEFVDFAKKKASGDRNLRWMMRDGVLHSLLEMRAAEVDFLGNLSTMKSSQIVGELDRANYLLNYGSMIHKEFSAGGATPNQYLLGLRGTATTGVPRSPEEERQELSQFAELVKSFIHEHPDPAADQGMELSHEAVAKQIDRKRASLRRAVLSYAQ